MIHEEWFLQEPFIDVAIGGNQIPGSNSGSLIVWAVTAHGRVSTKKTTKDKIFKTVFYFNLINLETPVF